MKSNKILYLGKSLRYFVNNIKIIVYQGHTEINLIDYLPLLKEGYTYKNNLISLIYYYQFLDKDNFDQIANKAFSGNIAREFYNAEFKNSKILMEDAIRERYIDKPINNSDLLIPERGYDEHVIRPLINYNAYTINDDKLLKEYSQDKNFLRRMDYESKIMSEIIEVIDVLQDQGYGNIINLLSFWNIMLEYFNDSNIYDIISTDDRIKLYIAIIEQDRDKVKDYLLIIDPRFDDNQAYVLAVEVGDKVVIKLIKDNIIRRSWYEKQVYLENIGLSGYDIFSQIKK